MVASGPAAHMLTGCFGVAKTLVDFNPARKGFRAGVQASRASRVNTFHTPVRRWSVGMLFFVPLDFLAWGLFSVGVWLGF